MLVYNIPIKNIKVQPVQTLLEPFQCQLEFNLFPIYVSLVFHGRFL